MTYTELADYLKELAAVSPGSMSEQVTVIVPGKIDRLLVSEVGHVEGEEDMGIALFGEW